MAVMMGRQGIVSLSSSCTPFTSFSGRKGIWTAIPSGAANASRQRVVAPLLFVFRPVVQGRAQLVTAPRDSQARGRSSSSSSSGRGCFDDAVALLASAPVLPKLVVLDLDFTVWPFYCWYFQSLELLPSLSFSADPAPDAEDLLAIEWVFPSPSDVIEDIDHLLLSAHHWAYGKAMGHAGPPTVYPDVVDIVKALASYKVEMAIASRSPSDSVAKSFLGELAISQHFASKEIYFTIFSKTKHFTALKEKTGVPFSSMLFFDDELKNVTAAARLGVTGVVVTDGLDLKSLEKGLKVFASKI